MRLQSARILLIDSQHSRYLQLAEMLEATEATVERYRLQWCSESRDALQYVLAGSFDAVLLSSDDREDECCALLEQLHELGVETPTILYSQTYHESLDQSAIQQGAADYLILSEMSELQFERALRKAIQRHLIASELSRQSHIDPLTKMFNRLWFQEHLGQLIERGEAGQLKPALLLLDLDGFRHINNTFGYQAGDQLVCEVAERLVAELRPGQQAARINGNEFGIILDNASADDVLIVIDRLLEVLSEPYEINQRPVVLSCSIGVGCYPEAGRWRDQLYNNATLALERAKRERGCYYYFYSDDLAKTQRSQIRLEADLRRALRNNEFVLHYQPRIDLESGRIVGAEGLIRWMHPTRDVITPDQFIPVAEEAGLILPLGYWVIQQACRDLNHLDQLGLGELELAVNISFKQIQDEKFVETSQRIIRESCANPERLEFELTETAVMSNFAATYEGMMALTSHGIEFSLDDFGTGYSSFAHLQQLPISAVKVDRSFVGRVDQSDDDAVIVKAMINLAHSLHLKVIAEGVENLEQVQFLWQNRCDQVQGFYFSKGVPLLELIELVQRPLAQEPPVSKRR